MKIVLLILAISYFVQMIIISKLIEEVDDLKANIRTKERQLNYFRGIKG